MEQPVFGRTEDGRQTSGLRITCHERKPSGRDDFCPAGYTRNELVFGNAAMKSPSVIGWMALLTLALLPAAMPGGTASHSAAEPMGAPTGGHALQQGGATAQDAFSFKVKVDMVTVDVVVINGRGGFVDDLAAEHFTVYDNGVAQEVTNFSRDQLPLAVALVVDRSPSIAPYLQALRSAAVSTLLQLKPRDEVVLFSFDKNVYRHGALTQNHFQIAHQLSLLAIGSGTNIYDAIFLAARYLRENAADRRRAIILVSDNVNSVPGRNRPEGTVRELLEARTTLYSIRTPGDNPGNPPSRGLPGAGTSVERIAGDTGGNVFDVRAAKSLSGALDWAIANLRMQYVLGFTPSDPGKDGALHKLVVRLSSQEICKDCRVQARSGYYSGTQARLGPPEPSVASSEPDNPEESLAYNRITTAAACGFDLNDLPFHIWASRSADALSPQEILVQLQIDPGKVEFRNVEGHHTGKLRIAIFYADDKGKVLGQIWYTMNLNLPEPEFQKVAASGIPFSQTIPLKHSKQVLRVVVYDPGSGRIGSRLVTGIQ